jgi:hypothetical protein
MTSTVERLFVHPTGASIPSEFQLLYRILYIYIYKVSATEDFSHLYVELAAELLLSQALWKQASL